MDTQLELRRTWFEPSYRDHNERLVIKTPQPGILYTCPCCGYPTLQRRGGYEICILCDWEDDGQDDLDADEVWGGPNHHLSLTTARDNFKRYRLKYAPHDKVTRISGNQNTIVEDQAKIAMVNAFDAMIDEGNPSHIENLWQTVRENERILHFETSRKIETYEEIVKLWDEHYHKPFPKGYGGKDFEGIDLVLLDTWIAGCIHTFIKYGENYPYRLDEERIASLERNIPDISIVLPHLNEAAQKDFLRLERMARLILEWVNSYERNS